MRLEHLTLILILTVMFTMLSSRVLAGNEDRLRLRCESDGVNNISMDARFETRNYHKIFDASFDAGANNIFIAGMNLEVMIAGVDIGSLRLVKTNQGDLIGDIKFDSRKGGRYFFPTNFPTVDDGTSVTIGPLGCSLSV